MVCVIDFDRTYFKNDFFQEFFFTKVIENPFYLFQHFIINKGNLVDLKNNLLGNTSLSYEADFLVNRSVHQWILENRDRYEKIVVVSASPDFFVKKLLAPLSLFDEIHGSTSKNLKGSAKLKFINEKWGNEFDYIGDSRADEPIFRKAKNAYKIANTGIVFVNRPSFIKLIRFNNWIKNLLIGFPLLLSGDFNIDSLLRAALGFICFSFLASGIYIINDIRDIEKDRLHNRKKSRPLASGNAKVETSFLLAVTLIVLAFAMNIYLGLIPFLVLSTYFLLTHFYSIYAKQVRFLDILILSSFYIIRVIYGAEITGVPLTGWFMATLTFSVLALSINKRYMECQIATNNKLPGRNYTKDDAALLYNLMFNFTMGAIILLNIHAYFVLSISSPYFYFLLNLAVAGIVLFYFDPKNKSDDPVDRILKNRPLLILVLVFITLYTYEVIMKTQ